MTTNEDELSKLGCLYSGHSASNIHAIFQVDPISDIVFFLYRQPGLPGN